MPGLSDRQSAGCAKTCERVMPLAATLRLFAAAGCAKQNGIPLAGHRVVVYQKPKTR